MQQFGLLVCLVSAAVAQVMIDPRGARPVEQGSRADKCATQKEWPFCIDDDWGSKCPSGCRIQGLMDKHDHDLLKKIEKIRSLLDQYKVKSRSADQGSKQTYDYLRDKLTVDAGNDDKYYDLAQNLRKRILDMKIKIDRQMRILASLKDRVKDQVTEMQKLEVDIDIKIRACKGSCGSQFEYQVDYDSYVTLDKQVAQLDSQTPQNIESVSTLYVMKSRPLQDVVVDNIYKSKDVAGQQRQEVFPEVKTVQLILEQEGSSSSPATISKVPVCLRVKQQKRDTDESSSHNHAFRKQCSAKSHGPLCSDDDWVSKCPSGCRLQGLISQMENDVEKKQWTACKMVKTFKDAAEKSMLMMTHIYNSNRRVIVNRYITELKLVDHADVLARNLTALRRRSTALSKKMKELNSKVRKQLEELYRTEVDIDVMLRTCQGSCRSVLPFAVDHRSYQELQSDLGFTDKRVKQKALAPLRPGDIQQLRLQTLDVGLTPSADYKMIPTVQRELLTQFEDIGQNQLVLEELMEESEDVNALNVVETE